MIDSRETYRAFCANNSSIPLFLRAEWLDLVSDKWNVATVAEGDEVRAIWVYSYSTKFGLTVVSQPALTPYSGLWFNHPKDRSISKRVSKEITYCRALIKQLPRFAYFQQKLSPDLLNILPLTWNNYTCVLSFTYYLQAIKNHELLFKNFKESLRRQIIKAQQYFTVETSGNGAALTNLYGQRIKKKNNNRYIGAEYVQRLITFCKEQNCGDIITVKQGPDIASMIFVVWDSNTAYFLFGGVYDQYKSNGAMSLALWEAIKLASKHVDTFNFEGSSIQGVERYFSTFNGQIEHCQVITKANGLVAKTWLALQQFTTK